jgi:GTP-dependent phosphoenolpyruvate carboxykinase
MGNTTMSKTPILYPGLYLYFRNYLDNTNKPSTVVAKIESIKTFPRCSHGIYDKLIPTTVDWLKAFKWIPRAVEKNVFLYYLPVGITIGINTDTMTIFIDRPNSRINIASGKYVHEIQHAMAFFTGVIPDLSDQDKTELSSKLKINVK